jgi:hypothetical protein
VRTILIDWRKDVQATQLDQNMKFLAFSPDGKWLLYWKNDGDSRQLMAHKINPANWDFLEHPAIHLGTFNRIIGNNAVTWMPEPMSYILIDEQKELLYQWIFEDKAKAE